MEKSEDFVITIQLLIIAQSYTNLDVLWNTVFTEQWHVNTEHR